MSPLPVADDGAGRLSIEGARYLLVRPETLAALQKAAEGVLGWDAAECLAAGGRAGGARAAAALPGERQARVRRLIEQGAALGWGRFALEDLANDRLVVTVANSPFAEAYGPSATPVCHLTRGVLESLAALTLDGSPRVIETACAAMGSPTCRFETASGGTPRPDSRGAGSRAPGAAPA
jgi:predicted hydrocarbon binding protein